ncbi:MAG: hypothetical protein IJS63_08460 [Bacteroidaceae bacterium]|nr:hypothetical protein [Bacteroidaceae bacterium]
MEVIRASGIYLLTTSKYNVKTRKEKGIGFYYKNDDVRQTMQSAAMSIDMVEELTGYDFFPLLPDDLEKRIEKQNNLTDWK